MKKLLTVIILGALLGLVPITNAARTSDAIDAKIDDFAESGENWISGVHQFDVNVKRPIRSLPDGTIYNVPFNASSLFVGKDNGRNGNEFICEKIFADYFYELDYSCLFDTKSIVTTGLGKTGRLNENEDYIVTVNIVPFRTSQWWTFRIDNTKPMVSLLSDARLYKEGPQSVSIDFRDPAYTNRFKEVKVSLSGYVLHNETQVSNGTRNFSFDTTGFSDGKHQLVLAATDLAGNISTASEEITIDNNAPTIDLNGPQTIELFVGENYHEQGARAFDMVSGDLTDRIIAESTVDTQKPGEYEVFYSITDDSGKISEISREVVVKEQPVQIIGTSQIAPPSPSSYPRALSVEPITLNNEVGTSSVEGLTDEKNVLGETKESDNASEHKEILGRVVETPNNFFDAMSVYVLVVLFGLTSIALLFLYKKHSPRHI